MKLCLLSEGHAQLFKWSQCGYGAVVPPQRVMALSQDLVCQCCGGSLNTCSHTFLLDLCWVTS